MMETIILFQIQSGFESTRDSHGIHYMDLGIDIDGPCYRKALVELGFGRGHGVCVYIHTYTHTYIHTYTHTYMHTYIHNIYI